MSYKIRDLIPPGKGGFLSFNRGLLGMQPRWQVWVSMLIAANLIAPLFFLAHVEAQATLAAGVLGMALMSALTARFGFSRIVGIGHVAWLPLLAFLGSRAADVPPTDAFGIWLRAVIALDTASLVLDAMDAIRFVRGERAEIVSTRLAPQE